MRWRALVYVLLLLAAPALAEPGTHGDAPKKKQKAAKTRLSAEHPVQFYGKMDTIAVTQSVRAAVPGVGSSSDPVDDNVGGVPVIRGSGISQRAALGFNFYLSPSLRAGLELASYIATGSTGVNVYWGVSAPWLSNVWTETGFVPPDAKPPVTPTYVRLVPNTIWLSHPESDGRLTFGTYHTTYVGNYMLDGLSNPGYFGSSILPLYGVDAKGAFGPRDAPGLRYELLYSDIPDRSAYRTRSLAGALSLEFGDHRSAITVNAAHTRNATPQAALADIPGLSYSLPVAPDSLLNNIFGAWQGVNGLPQQTAGPQAETTLGADVELLLNKRLDLMFHAEFAHSLYNPDTTGHLFATTAGGTLMRLGFNARPLPGLELKVLYLHVDPTYDPFVINLPIPPGIALFNPATQSPATTAQLHDTKIYPNNREGFDLHAVYRTPDRRTKITVTYSNYLEVKPTTIEQALTPGNIEPYFTPLLLGGNQKGRVPTFKSEVVHSWKEAKLWIKLSYERTNISRNGPELDAVDLPQTTWKLQIKHPVDDRLAIHAGYSRVMWQGHIGLLPTVETEDIPNLGLDLQLGDKSSVSLDYKIFGLSDHSGFGYATANQIMVEMKNQF